MSFAGFLRALATFALLVLLHYTLRPLLGWRAPVDFLLLAVLLTAVRVRPGFAAMLGFAIGLIADSLTPASLGAGAVGMTLVAYSASWLKAVFFAENLALNAFFFFAGKWAFDLIYFIGERRLGGFELLQQLALWSPLSAGVTALAGVLLLLLMRPLLNPSPA